MQRTLDGMVQAIDMTGHSVDLVGSAKDQDCHSLNGTIHTSKGVLGKTTMVKGALSYLGMGGLQ
jgi:hypothetical protein